MHAAGSVVWRKDFGGGESFTHLAVDPLDRRRLVLGGGAKGSFIIVRWGVAEGGRQDGAEGASVAH